MPASFSFPVILSKPYLKLRNSQTSEKPKMSKSSDVEVYLPPTEVTEIVSNAVVANKYYLDGTEIKVSCDFQCFFKIHLVISSLRWDEKLSVALDCKDLHTSCSFDSLGKAQESIFWEF